VSYLLEEKTRGVGGKEEEERERPGKGLKEELKESRSISVGSTSVATAFSNCLSICKLQYSKNSR